MGSWTGWSVIFSSDGNELVVDAHLAFELATFFQSCEFFLFLPLLFAGPADYFKA